MIEAPWAHRPRPDLSFPAHPILSGEPNTLAELRALRLRLRSQLSNGGRPAGADDEDLDRLLLAFEELVSNGLRHGGSPVQVVVTAAGSAWLVEVSDAAGDSPPVPAVGRDAALGGLGLYLVAQLSGAHGWTAEDDGRKVVWARVDFTGEAAPSLVAPGACAVETGSGRRRRRSRPREGTRLHGCDRPGAGGSRPTETAVPTRRSPAPPPAGWVRSRPASSW
jgi:anti-sigma regulatory factor (Ser/Thr protein kinase)